MVANLHVIDGFPKIGRIAGVPLHLPSSGKYFGMTQEEKEFISYWENNRQSLKSRRRQLLSGLPFGLLFSLPVLIALIYHNWYKRITHVTNAQLITVVLAVMTIAVFIAIFRKQFQWDQQEQLYKELKFREKIQGDAAE